MSTAPAIVLAAYLLGSIPFSFLVARAFGVRDVRRVGSGNVGATNVMRSVGKLAGAFALLLDVGKGAAATLAALRLFPADPVVGALAALAAIAGHMFPVWLRFRGGKGVATGFGAFLPLAPRAAALAAIVFALAVAATRYVSVGSIAAAVAMAALAHAFGAPAPVVAAAAVAAAFIVLRHRSNLHRLRQGTEPRLGQPRETV